MFRPAMTCALIAWPLILGAAPKDAEEAKLFFPTKVGDKWTYLFTEKAGKGKDKEWEIVETVTAVEDKKGVKVVRIGRFGEDGKVYPNRLREVSEKGVWQTESVGFGLLETPWCHLKLPHKDGQTWEDEEFHTAHGPERVKVPAGEYDAIRVEIRKRGEPKSDPIQTEWFAPRVGLVKLTKGNLVIVMKSFTAGKGKE